MPTNVYYDGKCLGNIECLTLEDIAEASGWSVDEILCDYADECLTPSEALEADKRDLERDVYDDIVDGDYDMRGKIDIKYVESKDEDDDKIETPLPETAAEPAKPTTVSIGYWTNAGSVKLEMKNLPEPKYAACGCPICDCRLKVFAKAERMNRMPTLYASTCQGCGAHICFGSDEEVFFPLKEEEDDKE